MSPFRRETVGVTLFQSQVKALVTKAFLSLDAKRLSEYLTGSGVFPVG